MNDNKLTPATDAEIKQAIDEALTEQEDEIAAMFSDEAIDAEYGDFMAEYEKATTYEERIAVLDKYNINHQI